MKIMFTRVTYDQWPKLLKTVGWTNQASYRNISVFFSIRTVYVKINYNNNIWHIPIKIVFLLRKIYCNNLKIHVYSSIMFNWPTYYCIHTKQHVEICKTGKLIKQNMPFNTSTDHTWCHPWSLQAILLYCVESWVSNSLLCVKEYIFSLVWIPFDDYSHYQKHSIYI